VEDRVFSCLGVVMGEVSPIGSCRLHFKRMLKTPELRQGDRSISKQRRRTASLVLPTPRIRTTESWVTLLQSPHQSYWYETFASVQ